jgi:DinB superfamily
MKATKTKGDNQMETKEILEKYEELAGYYMDELDKYSWELFTLKPSATEWSLGEMYNHLIETGFLQLASLQACATAPENRKLKKTWVGKWVYMTGAIPPIKAKVPPSAEHTSQQPRSREELRQKLEQLSAQMKAIAPSIDSISPDRKVKHPYFGYINAQEWYYHIVMHFAHHLRQKKRLDEFIAAHEA